MSGKAPPRGPRALLASFPPTNPPSAPLQQQSQQQQPARNPLPSTSTRIGAAPPTGPRSLTNGIYSKPPPQGPKGLVNGQAGFFGASQTNTGLPSHSLQNNRHPISIKGKKPENASGWPTSANWQASSAQANNRRESGAVSGDGLTSVGVNGSRPAISISIPTGPSSTKTQVLTRVNPPTQPAAMAQKSSDSSSQPAREPPPPPPPPSHSPPPPPPESPPANPPSPTGSPSVQHTPLSTPLLPFQPSGPPPSEPPPPPPPVPLDAPSSTSEPLQHDTRPPFVPNLSLDSNPALHPPPSPSEHLPPSAPQPSASLPLLLSAPSCPSAEPAAISPSSDPPPIPPSPPLPPQPTTREPPLPLAPSEVLPHAPISFELTSHSKSRPSIATGVSSSLLEGRSPTSWERRHSVSPPASPSQANCQTEPTDQASEPQEPSKSEPEPVFYSLPPLPDWPPPASEYPSGRNFKVLYDPAVEGSFSSQVLVHAKNGSNGQPLPLFYRSLIEHIRKNASSDVVQERIRGKAKGKEFLFRWEGRPFQVEGEGGLLEPEVVVRDPRKEEGFKRMPSQRSARNEFHLLKYEYDQNSVGPSPPTQVLALNLPPLLHNQHIRQHFSNHGPLLGFEPQIDKENGSALGIVLLKYSTHEEAKKCVTKENGKKTSSIGVGLAAKTGEDDEIRVVLDGEGLKLKAVLKELDERRKKEKEKEKKEKEEKRKKEKGQQPGASAASGSGSALGKAGMSTPQTPMGQTPNSSTQWRGGQAPQSSQARSSLSQNAVASSSSSSSSTSRLIHPSLPQNPTLLADATPGPAAEPTRPSSPATVSTNVAMPPMTHPLPAPPPPAARRPPASLVRARVDAIATPMAPYWSRRDRDQDRERSREKSRVRSRDRSLGRSRDRDWDKGRRDRDRHWSRSRSRDRDWRDRSRGRDWRERSRDTYWPDRDRDWRGKSRDRSRDRDRRDRSRDRDRRERSREKDREREHERDRGRRRSRERDWDTKRNRSSVSPSSKTEHQDRDLDHERERRSDSERFYRPISMGMSRSPSPAAMMEKLGSGLKDGVEKEYEHDEVLRVLAKNGMEYVKVEGGVQLMKTVRGEEVKTFFEGFQVDQVLRDRQAIYVTFQKPDNARRAAMVLGSRTLAYQFVTLTVHSPPADVPEPSKTKWEEGELVEHAQQSIIRELRTLLEKDISDRVVAPMLRRLVAEERTKSRGDAGVATLLEQKPLEKKGLKGLSFKKQPKKEVVPESKTELIIEAEKEDEEEDEDEEEVAERPRKRRKTEYVKKARKIMEEEVESEEEDVLDPARFAAVEELIKKRAASEDRDEEGDMLPARKRQKKEDDLVEKPRKGGRKKVAKKLHVDAVIPPDGWLPTPPEVAQIVVTPGSSLSRSPSPSAEPKLHVRVVTPPPTPPPDPFAEGLCEDDEDLFFAKLVLSGYRPSTPESDDEDKEFSPTDSPTSRKHITGSARTEGFYKISHKEKAAYVAQYQSRTTTHAAAAAIEEPAPQPVVSSRSNRANARRRAQGLEEINQVQRAVALSKGETAVSELTFKFNQLQTRKKHLRFARSPIHDWGLYAMEKISKGEMVIEYVGEVIRAQVADKREKTYERQGIGSSYLFRIDEDLVVDATKKGNLGRLINHSCDPNCTAKIIMISGEKKIVIYAKQDIELGEEITYDYHFPFEQDKIPCLCGSAKCRGYLN